MEAALEKKLQLLTNAELRLLKTAALAEGLNCLAAAVLVELVFRDAASPFGQTDEQRTAS